MNAGNTSESEPQSTDTERRKRKVEHPLEDKLSQHPNVKRMRRSDAEIGEPQATTKLRFSSLPIELLDLVFDQLNMVDVLSLSLTSTFLWNIGRHHIQNYCMSFFGQWAGESIICIGEDVKPGDCPPGMFAAEEKEEEEEETRDDSSQQSQKDEKDAQLINLYDFVDEKYTNQACLSPPRTLLGQLSRARYRTGLSTSDISRVYDTVSPYNLSSQYYPRTHAWILRNLATQEFVRADAIALKPEYIDGPHISRIGFGEVVLSRIAWSTSDSIAMRYNYQPGVCIHRGV